jgi:hypothetical protein
VGQRATGTPTFCRSLSALEQECHDPSEQEASTVLGWVLVFEETLLKNTIGREQAPLILRWVRLVLDFVVL